MPVKRTADRGDHLQLCVRPWACLMDDEVRGRRFGIGVLLASWLRLKVNRVEAANIKDASVREHAFVVSLR